MMATISGQKKRKTLYDFFGTLAEGPVARKHNNEDVIQEERVVPGLSVIPDFVDTTEEADLLSFLDKQNWRNDLARRVIHYGGTYCIMPPRRCSDKERKLIESTILAADPIPPAVGHVVDKMVEHQLYLNEARPECCIVNEYRGSQGISAHVENFRFGEPVCGLTLGDGDHMRFHELEAPHDGSVRSRKAGQAPKTGRRVDVWLPPRSLVVLRGEARDKWQHEIVRKKGNRAEGWKRTSLTFRFEKKSRVLRASPIVADRPCPSICNC